MPAIQFVVLIAMLLVLAVAVGLVITGAVIGHTGLFNVGADATKYVVGAVVGALAGWAAGFTSKK